MSDLIFMRPTLADVREPLQLIQISAFYNNEGNDGAGLSILPVDGVPSNQDPLNVIHQMLRKMSEEKDLPGSDEEILAMLESAADVYNLNKQDLMSAVNFVSCVYIAQLKGVIPCDEYNGMQFAYQAL